jgi:photosystem II stability/assembly factor-like uncharacterized protein
MKTLLFSLLLSLPLLLSGQWTHTNGIPGGYAGKFIQYGDTVIVSSGSELYYSVDHGQNWSRVNHSSPLNTYRSSRDGNRLVVGTYAYQTNTQYIRTDDFFQTEYPIAVPDSIYFYDVLAAGGSFFGSDSYHLWKTDNDGASWEYVRPQPLYDLQFDGHRITGNLYPYILQSKDFGVTWDTILHYNSSAYGLFQHDSLLLVFMENAAEGCYVSTDYGKTWNSHPGTSFGNVSDCFWHNDSVYVLTKHRLLASSDQGVSWSETILNGEPDFTPVHAIISGNNLLIGTDYGQHCIYRSTNGGYTGASFDKGMYSQSGRFNVFNQALHVTGTASVFQADTDQTNWTETRILASDPFTTDYLESGGNLIYCASGNAWFSKKNGSDWTRSEVDDFYQGAGAEVLHIVGNQVLLVTRFEDQTRYFISTDHGQTFTSKFGTPDFEKTEITVACNYDNSFLYFLTTSGKLHRYDPSNSTWTVMLSDIPVDLLNAQHNYNLQVWALNNYTAIFGVVNQVPTWLYTIDGGGTWQTATGLHFGTSPIADCIQVNNYLIAANANGVFASSDHGAHWTAWDEELSIHEVPYMTYFNDRIWIATNGGGIWNRPVADLDAQSIHGTVFWDKNQNGVQDPGEAGFKGVIVRDGVSGNATSTLEDGSYTLITRTPQTSVWISPPGSYWSIHPAEQTVTAPASNVDFAVFEQTSPTLLALIVWPNPATGTVYYQGGEPGGILQIWNTTGNLVREFPDQNVTGSFSVAGLSSGVYFVRMKGSNLTWRTTLYVN